MFAWMVSYTCINTNMNMTSFMLLFEFSGSLDTASDNQSDGESLFR